MTFATKGTDWVVQTQERVVSGAVVLRGCGSTLSPFHPYASCSTLLLAADKT